MQAILDLQMRLGVLYVSIFVRVGYRICTRYVLEAESLGRGVEEAGLEA